MDKLSAMATFVAVVDTGSFTRAAESLDLPKARVSQRISDLEAALGVRLLQRSTRALSLTKDGEVYGVLSRNRRKFRQPINVACPAPGRWGRPNSH